jgi:hypothetical protein
MQTKNDDFPYSSNDPSLATVNEVYPTLGLTSQQVGDLKATLRLVVGSVLNGKDAYLVRLRRVQTAQESNNTEIIEIAENESIRDQFKYLLLGILFETPDFLQRGLISTEQAVSKGYGLFSKVLSPITNSRIFRPVKNQYENAVTRGEKILDRLIMKGRMEERNSRLLLEQKNIDDLLNEFLEYVLLKTEVMGIVQEAGVGVAGDMTDDYREQSAAVDTLIEQKLRSFFHRRNPSQPVAPSNNPSEGG